MKENHLLDVEHWKDREIWGNYEIPYLFLGYNPKPYDSRPLDDYITLDKHEQEQYDQYFKLINEAIKLGKLITVESNLKGFCSLRAADVIKWRKNKTSINPVKIYLDMEDAIVVDTLPGAVEILGENNQEGKATNKTEQIINVSEQEKAPLDELQSRISNIFSSIKQGNKPEKIREMVSIILEYANEKSPGYSDNQIPGTYENLMGCVETLLDNTLDIKSETFKEYIKGKLGKCKDVAICKIAGKGSDPWPTVFPELYKR